MRIVRTFRRDKKQVLPAKLAVPTQTNNSFLTDQKLISGNAFGTANQKADLLGVFKETHTGKLVKERG